MVKENKYILLNLVLTVKSLRLISFSSFSENMPSDGNNEFNIFLYISAYYMNCSI